MIFLFCFAFLCIVHSISVTSVSQSVSQRRWTNLRWSMATMAVSSHPSETRWAEKSGVWLNVFWWLTRTNNSSSLVLAFGTAFGDDVNGQDGYSMRYSRWVRWNTIIFIFFSCSEFVLIFENIIYICKFVKTLDKRKTSNFHSKNLIITHREWLATFKS